MCIYIYIYIHISISVYPVQGLWGLGFARPEVCKIILVNTSTNN